MYIMSKDGLSLINMNKVETIYIKERTRAISATFPNGGGCHLAGYEKLENTKFALEALYSAITANDTIFRFPHETDLDTAKQHREHVKTKKTRHGGS